MDVADGGLRIAPGEAEKASRLRNSLPQWHRRFVVPVGLGLVLLTAGCAKSYQLLAGRVVDIPASLPPWLYGWFIAIELFLGTWLISGFYPRTAKTIARFTFGVLLAVALFQALTGASSCACFGAFKVSPWLAVLFDTGALGAIGIWKWTEDRRAKSNRGFLQPVAVLALFLSLGYGLSALAQERATTLLLASPEAIDLGAVPPGSSKEFKLTLTNPGSRRVVLEEVRSSCPCLQIRFDRGYIEPATAIEGYGLLDLHSEQQVTGVLAIRIKALTPSGEKAFEVQVNARVQKTN